MSRTLPPATMRFAMSLDAWATRGGEQTGKDETGGNLSAGGPEHDPAVAGVGSRRAMLCRQSAAAAGPPEGGGGEHARPIRRLVDGDDDEGAVLRSRLRLGCHPVLTPRSSARHALDPQTCRRGRGAVSKGRTRRIYRRTIFRPPDVCRGSGAASATRLLDRVSDPFKDVDGERGAFEPRRDDRDGRQPRRARFVKIARRDLLCFVEERVERVQVSRVAVQYPTTCTFTARVGGWGLINVIIPFRERNRTHTSAKKKTRKIIERKPRRPLAQFATARAGRDETHIHARTGATTGRASRARRRRRRARCLSQSAGGSPSVTGPLLHPGFKG